MQITEGTMKGKLICLLSFVVILTGCIVTPDQIRHKVRRIAAAVPQPKEGVELILETLKDSSGSDCIGAAYFWIYGTRVPLEEAFSSYRQVLIEEGWEERKIDETEIAPQFYKIMLGRFRKAGHTLFIDRIDDLDWAAARIGYYQEDYLKKRAGEFVALFMMHVAASSCDAW
jgi:hypothetical protein